MNIKKTHRRQVSMITVLLITLIGCAFQSLGQPPKPGFNENLNTADNIEIERQKVDIERQKLQLEKLKPWLTAGSILFPLVLGVVAAYLQMRTAFKIREAEAKSAFDLKAAEIVLNSADPFAASGRASALSELFPGRLPANFADCFDPGEVSDAGIEEMKILLPLLIEYKSDKQEILKLWKQIMPRDASWIERINC
ncbi:MAG TPA: hypothetical protein DC047_14615 [Blastocatellia bacterium]|nr:hypothetical protein [Blastocatellia bacterium]